MGYKVENGFLTWIDGLIFKLSNEQYEVLSNTYIKYIQGLLVSQYGIIRTKIPDESHYPKSYIYVSEDYMEN